MAAPKKKFKHYVINTQLYYIPNSKRLLTLKDFDLKKFNKKFNPKFFYKPFKNMFMEYLTFFDSLTFWEFFLQTLIIYNAFQLLKQKNFYYLLAYFFLYILFSGVYLIYIECSLAAILLWLIYFGVIIIFFVYSLMWFEQNKYFKTQVWSKNFYLYIFLGSCILVVWLKC